MSQPVFRLPCSGCQISVQVDLDNAVVAVQIPSNGKRGQGHVPAHRKSEDVTFDGGDPAQALAYWECPACGYADSTYADPKTRRALA